MSSPRRSSLLFVKYYYFRISKIFLVTVLTNTKEDPLCGVWGG